MAASMKQFSKNKLNLTRESQVIVRGRRHGRSLQIKLSTIDTVDGRISASVDRFSRFSDLRVFQFFGFFPLGFGVCGGLQSTGNCMEIHLDEFSAREVAYESSSTTGLFTRRTLACYQTAGLLIEY